MNTATAVVTATGAPMTRVHFRWRTPQRLECIRAIRTAVALGYDTRAALLAGLPQFSVDRLVLALEHLIAGGAAEVVAERLALSADLALFDGLVDTPLDLPVAPAQCSAKLIQEVLGRVGIADPVSALTLLRFDAQPLGDVHGA